MEDGNTTVETAQQDESGAAAERPSVIETLTAERDKLTAEKAGLEDLILRRQAEMDNFRRRIEREKADTREFASMDAVQALLPVLDDFERALKAAPGGYDEGPVAEYTKGMDLIYRRLMESLTKLGLEPIQAEGAPFDPNLHNAIQKEERSDVDDQTVLAEYQRGYHFKNRMLRPAMVKVAVRP